MKLQTLKNSPPVRGERRRRPGAATAALAVSTAGGTALLIEAAGSPGFSVHSVALIGL